MSFPTGAQVAERLYYDEPGLMDFSAEVTAVREVARVGGRQVWQIALDRTAFYPTGGGQPFDTGRLTATARSGALLEAPVTDVEEDDAGEIWHTTGKPLQEGTVVRGAVDAERRLDHMQQHSGQHLLSAILARDCGAKTVSFHLGPEQSTIDVADGNLTEDALRQAERAANQVIGQALPISIRFVSPEEAQRMLAEGGIRKLPPRSGPIRLIEIPATDRNACGGTHVANTAAIGPLLLRGTERVRDTLRIAFVCGNRALKAAYHDFQRLDAVARSLSTGPGDIAAAVTRLQAEVRSSSKQRESLMQALADAQASHLAADLERVGASVVTYTLPPEQPVPEASYAKLLALALIEKTPAKAAVIAVPDGERCSVILAAKPGITDCGSLLRGLLTTCGGRGGGTGDLAQGSLPIAALQHLLDSLRSHLGATVSAG